MSAKKNLPVDPPEKPVLLEDLVTALQKTFSRVSSTTQKNVKKNPDNPTARLGNVVDFEATVSLAPHNIDHLKVSADGPIRLLFKGQIRNDIQYIMDPMTTQEPAPASSADAR